MTGSRRLIGAIIVMLVLQGCEFALIEPTYRGRIEVWNRTEAPIKVVGREATIDVPACEHVAQDGFVLNSYDLYDARGGFLARHGGGGSGPNDVTPVYEMVTSDGAIYSDRTAPAEPLPECRGVAVGQTPWPAPTSSG